jgi:transposase
MSLLMLSDEHWWKLRRILLHKTIYNKRDRMTVEGILNRMRMGCRWRDFPQKFGGWGKVYKRFNVWSISGKWLKVFEMLVAHPEMEWVFIDGSYAKAHHSGCRLSGSDHREKSTRL